MAVLVYNNVINRLDPKISKDCIDSFILGLQPQLVSCAGIPFNWLFKAPWWRRKSLGTWKPMDPWVFTVSPFSSSGYPIPQPMAKDMSNKSSRGLPGAGDLFNHHCCFWFPAFLPLVGKQLIPPCWETNIFVCSWGGNKYRRPAKSNNPIKVQPTKSHQMLFQLLLPF